MNNETYINLYSGAASNTDSIKAKTFMNIISYNRKVHNKTKWNKKSESAAIGPSPHKSPFPAQSPRDRGGNVQGRLENGEEYGE